MNTAIIDNSLCNIDFLPSTSRECIKRYVNHLLNSGVSYIEIDKSIIPFLDKEKELFKHFILKIEDDEDLEYIKYFSFAYISVSLEMLDHIYEHISCQIILDVDASVESLDDILEQVYSRSTENYFSVLRLTGDFNNRISELQRFIKSCKRKLHFFIDICPLDSSLYGINAALAAFNSNADLLTLSFGENSVYTSLEKFWFFLYAFSYISEAKENFEKVCRAAVDYSIIVNSIPRGVKNINVDKNSITLEKKQLGKNKLKTKNENLYLLNEDEKNQIERVLESFYIQLSRNDSNNKKKKNDFN